MGVPRAFDKAVEPGFTLANTCTPRQVHAVSTRGRLRTTVSVWDWPAQEATKAMSRNKKAAERGGSKANLILTLLVLGIMAFVAIKICPVYFANYEFQDSIESESRFALTGYPKKTPDDVRNDVWSKAKDLGIPTQKDAIKIAMDSGSV